MISYKYGTYSDEQFLDSTTYIRKQIFYLLLYVDPKTKDKYKETDVCMAFNNLMYKLDGLNSLLFEPPALIQIMSMLESALLEYKKYLNNSGFNFNKYRKLILDAGNETLKISNKIMVDNAGNVVNHNKEIDKGV